MGAEIGQWNEWTELYSLDWHLMEHADHQQLNLFHKTTNQFYLDSPPLWEQDGSWAGFLWLCADDNLGNTLCYARWDVAGNPLVVVCNFSPVHRNGYRLPLPMAGKWQEALNSDWSEFGGDNQRNDGTLQSQEHSCYGQDHSLEINLPANATVVFRYLPEEGAEEGGENSGEKATEKKTSKPRKKSTLKTDSVEKKLGETLIIGDVDNMKQKRTAKQKMVEEVLGVSPSKTTPKKEAVKKETVKKEVPKKETPKPESPKAETPEPPEENTAAKKRGRGKKLKDEPVKVPARRGRTKK